MIVMSAAPSNAPITHTSGNGHFKIPEIKSSNSPTSAAASPNASTRHTARRGPECAIAPAITTVAAASSPACISSTVPRSSGAPGRFGSQAGSKIVTEPAQINNPRSRVVFHPPAPELRLFDFGTNFISPRSASRARRMSVNRPLPEFFGFAGKPRSCYNSAAVKTIFEKIRDGEIPADVIYRDEQCFAFRDISPQAPVHILIVPNQPIPRVGEAEPADQVLLGHLLLTAAKIASDLGLSESGFRVVINNGPHGGETVPHLHVHLLGGRQLNWPPG